MATKKIREVWAGPGVLSMGRRKIAIGKEIPKELESKARKSLRAKGMIVDEVVKPEDETVDLEAAAFDAIEAAEEAEDALKDAKAEAGDLAAVIAEAKTAASTAKGLNTKAKKALKEAGESASDEIKTAAVETETNFADAKAYFDSLVAESLDVEALAENAVRLRMEADKAAHAAETAK